MDAHTQPVAERSDATTTPENNEVGYEKSVEEWGILLTIFVQCQSLCAVVRCMQIKLRHLWNPQFSQVLKRLLKKQTEETTRNRLE